MDVRDTARNALARLLEPLTGFVFDSGLSIKDVHSILRAAAVRGVASRQLEISHRVNISGISASTGISRAEISRILKAKPINRHDDSDRHQQSTNKILAVWHGDPRYATPNGHPAVLKIYGRGPTFESLVKMHGKGIPTRAMLDELVRARAVELKSTQLIRLKTTVTVDRGVTPQAVKAFGDRVTELTATLLQNMRDSESSAFVANASHARFSVNELPLMRREIFSRGGEFLNEIQEIMGRAPVRNRNSSKLKSVPSVSVTLFYHEDRGEGKSGNGVPVKRRNFRRTQ